MWPMPMWPWPWALAASGAAMSAVAAIKDAIFFITDLRTRPARLVDWRRNACRNAGEPEPRMKSRTPMPPFKTICLAVFASALAASAHAQGRELDSLHRALNLTPAQEADWRAFAAASAPDAEQAARDRSAQSMLPGLHAPQRVDLTIAAMQADLDRQTAPRASDERYAPEPSDSDPF